MLRVIDTELPIPGLERPITLLQITDLHLIRTDDRDSAQIRALREKQLQWFPHSDEVLESIREFCREKAPDAVIFTGDVCGFPTKSNLEALRQFLREDCPPYLYVFGNHERMFFPEDLNEETCRRYTEEYAFALQGEPDVQVMECGGVLLIGLDDSDNQISPSQLERLKRLLERQLPCLLFMHVPLCLDTLLEDVVNVWGQPLLLGPPAGAVPDMDPMLLPNASTAAFCQLLTEQDTPVQAVFAGHVHFFVREDMFYPGKKQYIAPMTTTSDNGDGVARLIRLIPAK